VTRAPSVSCVDSNQSLCRLGSVCAGRLDSHITYSAAPTHRRDSSRPPDMWILRRSPSQDRGATRTSPRDRVHGRSAEGRLAPCSRRLRLLHLGVPRTGRTPVGQELIEPPLHSSALHPCSNRHFRSFERFFCDPHKLPEFRLSLTQLLTDAPKGHESSCHDCRQSHPCEPSVKIATRLASSGDKR
jgi:hypothetical protein